MQVVSCVDGFRRKARALEPVQPYNESVYLNHYLLYMEDRGAEETHREEYRARLGC